MKRAQRKLELSAAVVDESDVNILPAEKLSVESVRSSQLFDLSSKLFDFVSCFSSLYSFYVRQLQLTAIVQYGVSRLFKQDTSTASLSAASSSSTSTPAAGAEDTAVQDVENVQGASGQEVLDMDALIGPTRDGVWLKQRKRSEDTSVRSPFVALFA